MLAGWEIVRKRRVLGAMWFVLIFFITVPSMFFYIFLIGKGKLFGLVFGGVVVGCFYVDKWFEKRKLKLDSLLRRFLAEHRKERCEKEG